MRLKRSMRLKTRLYGSFQPIEDTTCRQFITLYTWLAVLAHVQNIGASWFVLLHDKGFQPRPHLTAQPSESFTLETPDLTNSRSQLKHAQSGSSFFIGFDRRGIGEQ